MTVGISGTLGGTGAISGTVYASGILAPGADAGNIGNLAVGTTFWNGGATKTWNFDLAATSESSDLLSIIGDFNKGSGTTFKFDFMGSSPDAGGNVYTLITWTGDTNFLETDFSFQGLTGSFNSGSFSITANSLQFTVVPEPSGSLVAILFAVAGLRHRRRASIYAPSARG